MRELGNIFAPNDFSKSNPERDREAHDSADAGEHRGFREQLRDQPSPAGAHGGADGHFALARIGARSIRLATFAQRSKQEPDSAEQDEKRMRNGGGEFLQANRVVMRVCVSSGGSTRFTERSTRFATVARVTPGLSGR